MKFIFSTLVLCLVFQFSFAQSVYQRTAKKISPDNPFPEEEIFAMDPTTDGGYILAGFSNNDVDKDMYLLKVNSDGETEWMTNYVKDDQQEARDVKQTSDGGYILVGWDQSAQRGMAIIKTDAEGAIVWSRRYGGDFSEYGRSVVETPDGGFVIAGEKRTSSWNNVYLLKIDANGDFVWNNSFGGELFQDNGFELILTNDTGFMIVGEYAHNSNREVYLIKTDSSGAQTWAKTYGSVPNIGGADKGRDVKQTSDGGYIVAGEYQDPDGTADKALVFKTDESGMLQWAKKYNRPNNEHSIAHAIDECDDGSYIFTGTTDAGFGSADVLLTKITSTGDVVWAKGMGEAGGEIGFDVVQKSDGGYFLAGSTIGSFGEGAAIGQLTPYLINTDALGNSGGCFVTDVDYSADDVILAVNNVTSGVGVTITSTSPDFTANSYSSNDSLLCETIVSTRNVFENITLKIYPNPSTGQVRINVPVELDLNNFNFTFLNSQGVQINLATDLNIANNSISFNNNNKLMQGLYFITIESNNRRFIGKVIMKGQ